MFNVLLAILTGSVSTKTLSASAFRDLSSAPAKLVEPTLFMPVITVGATAVTVGEASTLSPAALISVLMTDSSALPSLAIGFTPVFKTSAKAAATSV